MFYSVRGDGHGGPPRPRAPLRPAGRLGPRGRPLARLHHLEPASQHRRRRRRDRVRGLGASVRGLETRLVLAGRAAPDRAAARPPRMAGTTGLASLVRRRLGRRAGTGPGGSPDHHRRSMAPAMTHPRGVDPRQRPHDGQASPGSQTPRRWRICRGPASPRQGPITSIARRRATGRSFMGDRTRPRLGAGVPELPRLCAERLGGRVPRLQPGPPSRSQAHVRPRPLISLPTGHLTPSKGSPQ